MKEPCNGEKILEYLYGVLSDEDRAALEEHLNACPDCKRFLDEERHLDNLLESLPEFEPSSTFYDSFRERLRTLRTPARERRSFRRILVPAGLAIAVILVISLVILPMRAAKEREIVENIEVLQNMELLENYDLLMNLDDLELLTSEGIEDIEGWIG